MLLRHAFGEVLRRRRRILGKTLQQVAADSRVSLPYLSEIERGRKEPSSEILAAVCAVLHLGLSDLLADAVSLLNASPRDRAGRASIAPVLDLTSQRESRADASAEPSPAERRHSGEVALAA